MKTRYFLVQQFITLLIIWRTYWQMIPLQYFGLVLFLLIVAKYFKEGFTPTIVIIVILIVMLFIGEINKNQLLIYLTAVAVGIHHFLAPKFYWLPDRPKLVGFREDSVENELYYGQFYPLDQSKGIKEANIKWNHHKEVFKMLQYAGVKNKFLVKIAQFFLTYVNHQQIKIAEGIEQKSNTSVAFCHGRGGTGFMYTQFILPFAEQGINVGFVQHTEKSDTGLKQKTQIKAFRQKEVQMRAAEYYQTILKINNQKIILMGHSYGCSTLIQAYHSLESELSLKISHIILLDPWFFPLADDKMKKQIKCPILILVNEDFVSLQDIYNRNNQFLKYHERCQYIIWKGANHLHQTDLGFISGSLFGIVKDSHLSQVMVGLNMVAIDRFIKGQQVEGTFGDRELSRTFKPIKFKKDNFKY